MNVLLRKRINRGNILRTGITKDAFNSADRIYSTQFFVVIVAVMSLFPCLMQAQDNSQNSIQFVEMDDRGLRPDLSVPNKGFICGNNILVVGSFVSQEKIGDSPTVLYGTNENIIIGHDPICKTTLRVESVEEGFYEGETISFRHQPVSNRNGMDVKVNGNAHHFMCLVSISVSGDYIVQQQGNIFPVFKTKQGDYIVPGAQNFHMKTDADRLKHSVDISEEEGVSLDYLKSLVSWEDVTDEIKANFKSIGGKLVPIEGIDAKEYMKEKVWVTLW